MIDRRIFGPGALALSLAMTPLAMTTLATSGSAYAAQTDAPQPSQSSQEPELTTVASDLAHPWGMAFLPDGAMLVTERAGRLVLIGPDGARHQVAGTPDVAARGQGGLLDVALDPDFAENRLVYLSFSEPGEGGIGTSVARGTLDEDRQALSGLEVIYRQRPKLSTTRHYGSRLVFAPDGTLFVTQGDRGNRPMAQDASNLVGTLVRINPDGSIPEDNPFVDDPNVADEIYSYGHRNIQGADLDADGNLWTVEHGARGGDEVNKPQAGNNYGWPTISYGRHYSGGRIGVGTAAEGMEQPVYYWDPSIAPSGLAVVDGGMFPDWQGNILVGALKDQLLSRLVMEGDEVVAEEQLLKGRIGRIREVEIGPDGAIYLLSDADSGAVYRLAGPGT